MVLIYLRVSDISKIDVEIIMELTIKCFSFNLVARHDKSVLRRLFSKRLTKHSIHKETFEKDDDVAHKDMNEVQYFFSPFSL